MQSSMVFYENTGLLNLYDIVRYCQVIFFISKKRMEHPFTVGTSLDFQTEVNNAFSSLTSVPWGYAGLFRIINNLLY